MKIVIRELRHLIREAMTGEETTVWRGMTGISEQDLIKMIGTNPKKKGHATTHRVVSLSKMGWWSERRGVAMAYASTDPVRGRRPGYDVMLKGQVERPQDAGDDVTHDLRKTPKTRVRITDVYYALPDSSNRKEALTALIDGSSTALTSRRSAA